MASRFAGLSVSLALFVAACSSDLFHSTDWPTLCEKNPKANGCPGANDDGATSASSATSSATSGGGGGGGAGGGGGGAMPCIQEATCADCRACTRPLLCEAEVTSCAAEPDCQPLLDCVYACKNDDLACIQGCATSFPAGQDAASALFACEACGECEAECGYPCP